MEGSTWSLFAHHAFVLGGGIDESKLHTKRRRTRYSSGSNSTRTKSNGVRTTKTNANNQFDSSIPTLPSFPSTLTQDKDATDSSTSSNQTNGTTRNKETTTLDSNIDDLCEYYQQIMDEPMNEGISKQNLIDATKAKENAALQTTKLEEQIKQLQQQLKECYEDLENSKLEIKLTNDLWIKRQLQIPCQWNTMFRLLLDYKKQYGNLLIPHTYKHHSDSDNNSGVALGRFVGNQRVFYKYYLNGDLKHIKKYRIDLLNQIGFIWNPKENAWLYKYNELKQFYQQNGHCYVPNPSSSSSSNSTSELATKNVNSNVNASPPDQLYKWTLTQRQEWNAIKRGAPSTLTPERIDMLKQIHFPFEQQPHFQNIFKINDNNQQQILLLNPSCTSNNSKKNRCEEYQYVKKKRRNRSKKTIGVSTASSKESSHCNSTITNSTTTSVGDTSMNLSTTTETETVSLDEKAKLGMTPDEMWYFRYKQLKEFHRIHGHVYVNKRKLSDNSTSNSNNKLVCASNDNSTHCASSSNTTKNSSTPKRATRVVPLIGWLASQRNQYEYRREGKHHMHTLTNEKIQLLEDLGVKWRKPKHEPRKG